MATSVWTVISGNCPALLTSARFSGKDARKYSSPLISLMIFRSKRWYRIHSLRRTNWYAKEICMAVAWVFFFASKPDWHQYLWSPAPLNDTLARKNLNDFDRLDLVYSLDSIPTWIPTLLYSSWLLAISVLRLKSQSRSPSESTWTVWSRK